MQGLILVFISVFATFSAYKSIYLPCNIKGQRNSRVWRASISVDIPRGPVEMIQTSVCVKVGYFCGCVMSLTLVGIIWNIYKIPVTIQYIISIMLYSDMFRLENSSSGYIKTTF
jgi:hypothetical protein